MSPADDLPHCKDIAAGLILNHHPVQVLRVSHSSESGGEQGVFLSRPNARLLRDLGEQLQKLCTSSRAKPNHYSIRLLIETAEVDEWATSSVGTK